MQSSVSGWREAAGRMGRARQCLVPTPHLRQVQCRAGGASWPCRLPPPEGSRNISPCFAFSSQAEQTHKWASFSWLVGRSSLRETLWMGIHSMSRELQMFRGGERNPQAVTVLKTPQLWAKRYYDF